MSDMILWYEGNDQYNCNVFSVRASMHPSYGAMYDTFNKRVKYPSVQSLESDFPMDHFTFFMEEDEKNFVEEYKEYIKVVEQFPPKKWRRPKDPAGIQWCDRCRTFHQVPDPNADPLEEELSKMFADEIQKEMDEELLQELLLLMKAKQ